MNCSASAAWRSALLRDTKNSCYLPWLRDRGSLTARIQARGAFAVRLLHQGLTVPAADEAVLLGIRPGVRVWGREVALLCDGLVVAYAQALLPCRPRGPVTLWLARLGNRSLGSLFFSQARFERGEIAFKRLDARHPLFGSACRLIGGEAKTLWARRSLFVFGSQSVLVTEVLAPILCCT